MNNARNIQEFVAQKVIEHLEDYETQNRKLKNALENNGIYECQHCKEYKRETKRCIDCLKYGCNDCSNIYGIPIFEWGSYSIPYKCDNCVPN